MMNNDITELWEETTRKNSTTFVVHTKDTEKTSYCVRLRSFAEKMDFWVYIIAEQFAECTSVVPNPCSCVGGTKYSKAKNKLTQSTGIEGIGVFKNHNYIPQ
jgi:uncharacterized protein YchJ